MGPVSNNLWLNVYPSLAEDTRGFPGPFLGTEGNLFSLLPLEDHHLMEALVDGSELVLEKLHMPHGSHRVRSFQGGYEFFFIRRAGLVDGIGQGNQGYVRNDRPVVGFPVVSFLVLGHPVFRLGEKLGVLGGSREPCGGSPDLNPADVFGIFFQGIPVFRKPHAHRIQEHFRRKTQLLGLLGEKDGVAGVTNPVENFRPGHSDLGQQGREIESSGFEGLKGDQFEPFLGEVLLGHLGVGHPVRVSS